MTEPTILVYECTFYTIDENGKETIYEAPKLDWSHIAEYVTMEDLVEINQDKECLCTGVQLYLDEECSKCGRKN
jgi:hypothetical protein